MNQKYVFTKTCLPTKPKKQFSLKDNSNSPGLIYSRCLKDQRDDTTLLYFFSDYQNNDRN